MTSAAERVRWAVGVEGPVVSHELVRADFIRYAGASGDFFPLHTDDDYAEAAGFETVFAHGMYLAGLLATAVTNWVGIGSLRSYRVRFVSKAWPGDVLRSRLEITDVRAEGMVLRVEIDCRLVDSAGQVRIRGMAIAHVNGDCDATPRTEEGSPA